MLNTEAMLTHIEWTFDCLFLKVSSQYIMVFIIFSTADNWLIVMNASLPGKTEGAFPLHPSQRLIGSQSELNWPELQTIYIWSAHLNFHLVFVKNIFRIYIYWNIYSFPIDCIHRFAFRSLFEVQSYRNSLVLRPWIWPIQKIDTKGIDILYSVDTLCKSKQYRGPETTAVSKHYGIEGRNEKPFKQGPERGATLR